MELEAPGGDIVGFERPAETDADRTAVSEAREVLSRPLEIFAPPREAGCKVAWAAVELEGHVEEAHHQDDEKEHPEEEDAEHSGFHAEYRLTCADPSAIAFIGFPCFAKFPDAQELEVKVVSDRAARQCELERDVPDPPLHGGL